MDNQFQAIASEYDQYYKSLFQKGRLPLKSTAKGFWGYSIAEEVYELFKKIKLEQYKSFVDLGSGDGKVVLIASLFTKAIGIEIDEELVRKSEEMKAKLNLNRAHFLQKDFFQEDLSSYEAIYLFPDQRTRAVEDKLLKEMKGILLFMGQQFRPLRLKEVKQQFLSLTPFTVYTNPEQKHL